MKANQDGDNTEAELTGLLTSLRETTADMDEAYAHGECLAVETCFLLLKKAQLESRLEVIPIQDMMVECYQKFEEFVDATLEAINSQNTNFHQVVVDDVKTVNPQLPLGEVWSLENFIEGVYVCLTHPSEAFEESWDASLMPLFLKARSPSMLA